MLTIRKPFGICFSTRATLARSTRIDGQEPSPGAFGLVQKFLKECHPSCIVYRFSQLATGQAFYVQVFHKNDSVVVDDLSRQLVLKIVALVESLAVNLGHQANRFLPALRELLSTCYPSLCSSKTDASALFGTNEDYPFAVRRSASRTTTARHQDQPPYRSLAVVRALPCN